MERNIDKSIFMNTNTTTAAPTPEPVIENPTKNSTTYCDVLPKLNIKERGDGTKDVITISHLRQIFNQGEPNEYPLFDDFSLNIPDFPGKGQLVSIMGGSGCGKSCLLRAIAGLTTIPEGEIKVYDTPLEKWGSFPMVFQTYSNYEWMTVLENVMLPMTIKGVPKEEAKAKAIELIKLVGLEDHIDKYAKNGSLSGGQLQRVSIARSLACNSQIILFDEATGALDINMKREVQNIILKIFYESELDPTILNVTHSVEEAVYLSNRVIILKPKPCTVYQTIDIHFPGEESKPRGPWVLETPEFAQYTKMITRYLDEVCK